MMIFFCQSKREVRAISYQIVCFLFCNFHPQFVTLLLSEGIYMSIKKVKTVTQKSTSQNVAQKLPQKFVKSG